MFPNRDTIFVVWLVKKLIKLVHSVPKRFRIYRLGLLNRSGFKLTNNERTELAQWITRNVTESTSETLRKVWSGEE